MRMFAKCGLGAALIALSGSAAYPAEAQDKPRLIVITDIGTEPDDIESMVRVLTYANEIDIEGLIASTSRHLSHKVYPQLIEQRVNAYGQVLANLRVHDPAYPDAALLKSRIRAWRPEPGMTGVGQGKDNDASRLIVDTVDKSDGRPVWVSIWGGAAPLAQALWSVQHSRSPREVAKFVSRLRVYSISDQDDAGPWARATFPHLFWIASIHGISKYDLATWTGISAAYPGADNAIVSRDWLRSNIQSKGPLGQLYPLPLFIMEGDTPSFLNLIGNGLSVPERPDWGGWGGRWEQPSPAFGHWADTVDAVKGEDGKDYSSNKATVWRWRKAFQNDFLMRMNWSVSPRFADANHAPKLVVNGQGGTAPLTLSVCPGQEVNLSAAGTSDPDGNALTYRWWSYGEAGSSYFARAAISSPSAVATTVTVKPWTAPAGFELLPVEKAHVILEVSDNGVPVVTRYRRIVLDVATDGRRVDGKACPRIETMPEPEGIDFATGAEVATEGWSTAHSDIGSLLDNPQTRAIVARHLPMVVDTASAAVQARNMTLKALKAFVPGITDEILAKVDAELKAVPKD